MKQRVITIAMLLLVGAAHGQDLDEYVQLAIGYNPGLQAQRASFEAALQRVDEARGFPDPTLSVSAFGPMMETRLGPQRAIFILNQMFPWFGTLRAEGNVAAKEAEATLQEWLDERSDLVRRVKSAYYPLYELHHSIRLKEEELALLETDKAIATVAFQNGRGTMADVLRVDLMREGLLTDAQLLRDRLVPLRASFNALLGRADTAAVTVPDSLSIPECRTAGLRDSIPSNPRLRAIDSRLGAAAATQVAARKQGLPQLGVGLNYTIIGQRTDATVEGNGRDAIMPMVSLSLPIFRKKYRAARAEANYLQQEYSSRHADLANQLEADYEAADYEVEKAAKEYSLYRGQVQKAETVVRLLLADYQNSGTNFQEVLRMQQELLTYRLAVVTAVKDYYIAEARLEYVAGQ